MPPASAISRPSLLVHLGVLGGWLLFTLMVIAISWGGAVVRGRPPAWGGVLVWNAGWMLWAAATFVVMHLARRFPIERQAPGRGLALHAVWGIALSLAILALEFLLGQAIAWLWPGAPRANAFLGFIVYKFHVYFLIYWMVLGATRAFDFHEKYRATELHASQLDARLAQAQLQSLKAQLHPHFLFNTHHAIISLMLKQENAAAIRMLTRLSDLLRVTLRHTDQQVAPLRDELDALELYLGVQRERYGDRLHVELAVDPLALSAEVPWLLLQPLVENALKHGIDALPAGGRLSIRAARETTRLQLSVEDGGPGFPASFDPASSPGIGLRNTEARLARLYGAEHRIEFHNVSPHGARVVVTLPFRSGPAAAPSPGTPDSAHA